MIAILDYGSGNIRSAQRACETTGEKVIITSDRETAINAAGLVVPGVGAFGACISSLRSIGGDEIINSRIASKRPILGICVGMQILFDESEESQGSKGGVAGLGLISGSIDRLENPVLPHIGWNTVDAPEDSRLFAGIKDQRFYFVHSYAASSTRTPGLVTTTNYGNTFIAAFEDGPISAVQFHPEKSGAAGLQLIANWVASL